MDLTMIATALGSLKTATDIAKFIKDSNISLEQAESKLKLAELVTALADARTSIAEIQNALLEKDAEIKKLEDQLRVNGKLAWEPPYYWLVDGEKKEGPYCQQCKDKDRILIRLQGNGEGLWECKTCKNRYGDAKWRAFLKQQTRSHSDYEPLG